MYPYPYQNSLGTRLEILSTPKAPKILQELLSNSEKLLSPRPTKLLKDSKRFQKNPIDSERFQKNPKDSKRFQSIPKDTKRFQKIPKDSLDLEAASSRYSTSSQCSLLKKLMAPLLFLLPPKNQRLRGACVA